MSTFNYEKQHRIRRSEPVPLTARAPLGHAQLEELLGTTAPKAEHGSANGGGVIPPRTDGLGRGPDLGRHSVLEIAPEEISREGDRNGPELSGIGFQPPACHGDVVAVTVSGGEGKPKVRPALKPSFDLALRGREVLGRNQHQEPAPPLRGGGGVDPYPASEEGGEGRVTGVTERQRGVKRTPIARHCLKNKIREGDFRPFDVDQHPGNAGQCPSQVGGSDPRVPTFEVALEIPSDLGGCPPGPSGVAFRRTPDHRRADADHVREGCRDLRAGKARAPLDHLGPVGRAEVFDVGRDRSRLRPWRLGA